MSANQLYFKNVCIILERQKFVVLALHPFLCLGVKAHLTGFSGVF